MLPCVALLGLAADARAQIVRGTVRDGTGQPVVGALVELMRGGRHVTRALSDEAGRYRLMAPQGGRYGMRVLRIGFRTTRPVEIDVPASGTLAHDPLAPMIAVHLDDVQIRAEKRCVVDIFGRGGAVKQYGGQCGTDGTRQTCP